MQDKPDTGAPSPAARAASAAAAVWQRSLSLLRAVRLRLRFAWSGLSAGARMGLAAAAALLFVWQAWSWRHVPGHWLDYLNGHRPLAYARSWHYYLSDLEVDRAAASTADVLVIDYATGDGDKPLTRDDLARLKKKPDGSPRLVISYISIGEAEAYRYYWAGSWSFDEPGWHVVENCAWPRNHMVLFWHDGWKDIIYRGKRSYIQRIIDAGFDGVYLDRVDVFDYLTDQRPTAEADMKEFVIDLAARARKAKPGFIIMVQNAESLLADRRFRDTIDGLGKEDLLYGLGATEGRNAAHNIAYSRRYLSKLLWDWKPVFAVEYLASKDLIASARRELTGLGMVPTFAHRSLDGRDPSEPRPPSSIKYGTAEWVANNCIGKKHW